MEGWSILLEDCSGWSPLEEHQPDAQAHSDGGTAAALLFRDEAALPARVAQWSGHNHSDTESGQSPREDGSNCGDRGAPV